MEKIKAGAALILIITGLFMPIIGLFIMPTMDAAIAFMIASLVPVMFGCALID